MAMALGGGAELRYADSAICADADPALPPLLRATELVVRNFCVGEALSIPLLHGAWMRATHPLAHAVLGRIVKDEAAHGIVGWTYLDWALPQLDAGGVAFVRRTAEAAIGEIPAPLGFVSRGGRARPPATGTRWDGSARTTTWRSPNARCTRAWSAPSPRAASTCRPRPARTTARPAP